MHERTLCVAAIVAILASPGIALADRPMAIDDASTLAPGDAKLDFGVERDGNARGFFGAITYGPLARFEVELALGHLRDRRASPIETIHAVGVALKWAPLQADQGLSAGLKIGYLDERERHTAHNSARTLDVLLHWNTRSGVRIAANAGRAWMHDHRTSDESLGTWGIGLDIPVGTALNFTAETFGVDGSGPDRQVGLRYGLAPDLALWAAVGRGNDANFASLGVTWLF